MPQYEQSPEAARKYFQRYLDTVKDTFLDSHTKSLVRHYGREAALPEFEEFGRVCAREIDTLARVTNKVALLPRLEAWDGFGNHTASIAYSEQHHTIGRLGYAAGGGLMAKYKTPGSELLALVHFYLFSLNGEAGHACPITCTAGVVKLLHRAAPSGHPLLREWLERLQDPNYDTHYHAAQFLTEIQGGSDVGGNVVKAVPVEDDPTYKGWYRLHGEKWFCSVADAQLIMIVARPEGAAPGTKALRAYIALRHLPYGDKKVNAFRIRRLKDKLGTRSMASAEFELMGTLALPLECSFIEVLDIVVNNSRLYNAMAGAAAIERSYLEAAAYAGNRIAFDKPIIQFPAVANTVAKLRAEAYAGRSVCFFLADMMDKMPTLNKSQKLVWRITTNMTKMWLAEISVAMQHSAIDVFGGNGAIEEFSVLPRLLRDGVVSQQWEGPTNTLSAQTFRDCQRYKMHTHLFAFLHTLAKQHPTARLAEVEAEWEWLLSLPNSRGLQHFKEAIMALRPVLQYLLLMTEGNKHDPVVTAAAEHVLRINNPAYSAARDPEFESRVRFLAAQPAPPKL